MKILMFSTHLMKYIWYSPQKSKYPLLTVCLPSASFNSTAGPFKAQFQALLEPKCIQYANKEDGLNRRRHYSQGLTKEAVRKHIPQLQEVRLGKTYHRLRYREYKVGIKFNRQGFENAC